MSLKIGDKIPLFSAVDNKGDLFEIETLLGQKALVIYFYPKDNTPGCTIQACTFRDQYDDFQDLGAEVIGISSDSLQSHIKFSSKYQLPFILLSDANGSIRKAFGVPTDFLGLFPGRATYVVDKRGMVQYIFDSASPKIHIQKALEKLKTM